MAGHPAGHIARAALAIMLAAWGAALAVTDAGAQDYPTRPIRIIVPLPPAAAPDIVARVIGQRLSERLGKGVVIENRAGANGSIGGEVVARAAPDGYTLLLPQDSLIVVNPHVYSKMSFNPMTDLVPVCVVGSNRFYLSVTPSLPANTLQELVALAKRTTPPLQYGSAGDGSQHQLAMEQLKRRAGIDLLHVPYKGATPAATAVVGGQVAAMFAGGATLPLIKAGKLRALAVSSRERAPEFPDLPTIGETYPGFEISNWFALFAPAGTPAGVIAILRREVAAIAQEPDVVKRLNDGGGIQPLLMPPEAFAALVRRDYESFGQLVRSIDLSLN